MNYYFSGGTGTFSTGSMTSTFGGYVAIQPVIEVPVLCGEGPPAWSTCTDLDIAPRHIHDGNHYYRALGFEWPFRGITRRDLMRAYRRTVGAGQDGENAAYATYALSQLLDPEVRWHYDRMPFGRQLIDKYLAEMIRKKAIQDAAEAQKRGHEVTPDDLLRMWGVPTEPIEPVDDAEGPLVDTVQNPSALSDLTDTVPDAWPWGYYTWRSSCGDGDRLARWQELLLAVAQARSLRARFAIGFVGRTPREWVVAQLQSCFVIFLHEAVEPTGVLAALAVDEVTRVIHEVTE
jgi:hypothetical protein